MVRVSSYRENNPAPGELQHPALSLANSRRNSPTGVIEEFASPASLLAWLDRLGLAPARACTASDVKSFLELRASIRELLLARIEDRPPDGDALARLNEAASAAPSAAQLEWAADGPRERHEPLGASGIELAQATIAADAIELIAGERWGDLRACSAPGCVRLLLRDHPRRQWCCNRCGDRVRASRYYHRHRAAG
jgi:predicted RNA-binding Zn ribbon-like protein